MQATLLDVTTYEPAIRRARLELLRVGEHDGDSAARCLRRLRDAGLQATPSRMEPGGVVGGLTKVPVLDTVMFEDSFEIRPVEEGFALAVPGLGRFDDEVVPSLLDAADRVIAIYGELAHLTQRR